MMKSWISSFLLVFCFISSALPATGWSLRDPNQGWNTPELVKLYFHNSDMQTQWAWKALSHHRFNGDESILDFGCGDGKLTAMISCLVPDGHVLGLDLSKQMIFHASKMYSATRYPNVSFVQGKLEELSAEKFDVVTSFCVFHLIPNPEEVFKKIQEKMKPGAKLVMTYPIGGNPEFFKIVLEELALRGWTLPSPTESSKQMRDPEHARSLLMSLGFKLEHFEVVDTRDAFASLEEFIDWLEGTLAANWQIPKEGRREFFTDVATRYFNSRPSERDDDGFVYYSLHRIDLVASNEQ